MANKSLKQELAGLTPELKAFFRNQQRFVHLYALVRGEIVSVGYITELMQMLDPERSFSPQTYYGLRRELQEAGWIESVGEAAGRAEIPHRVLPARLSEFAAGVVEVGLVERPVSIDKYQMLDTGLRLSSLLSDYKEDPALMEQWGEALDRHRMSLADKGYTAAFVPDYLLRQAVSDFSALVVSVVSEALAAANAIEDTYERAKALTALAPQLKEPQHTEVLKAAHNAALGIKNKGTQTTILERVARQWLPPGFRKILAGAGSKVNDLLEGIVKFSSFSGGEVWPAFAPSVGIKTRGGSLRVRGGATQGKDLFAAKLYQGHGKLRLSASVTAPGLGHPRVTYRLGEVSGQMELDSAAERWENVAPLEGIASVSDALQSLTLTLIGAGPSPSVLLLEVGCDQGDGARLSVTLCSRGTGLSGVEVHYLVDGIHRIAKTDPAQDDTWIVQDQVELPSPPPKEFCVWVQKRTQRQ